MSAPPPGWLQARRPVGGRLTPPVRSTRPAPPPFSGQHPPLRLRPAPALDRDLLSTCCTRTTLCLLVDDSGSMQDDPQGVRCAAGKAMTRFLREFGGGRVGVVHWTHRVETELAPVDVRRGRRALDHALAAATARGGNDVARALRRSHALLPVPAADEHQAVIVLTDGQEFSVQRDAAVHLADVEGAVMDLLPAAVHVVLIDHHGRCSPGEESAWRTLPIASFSRMTLTDPDYFCWEVAAVVLGAHGIEFAPYQPRTRRFPR